MKNYPKKKNLLTKICSISMATLLFSVMAYACETYFVYDADGRLLRCMKCGQVITCN